jgi:GNAT superfamily N-acetyltransferase
MVAMKIREARAGDAPELAELTTQLGYPSTAADIARRLPFHLGRDDERVLVAADDDRAAAWIHVALQRSLEDDPYAVILGLVVAEPLRGGGIGARLVAEAERWARGQGLPLVRVRSNVVRERTHRFYQKLGYALTKTSHLFVKRLT